MNEAFYSWWRTRTLREQRLLLATAGLLALVLAWLLVVRPLGDALATARERHGEAVVELAEARAAAAAIGRLEGDAPSTLPGPIDTMINQSAADAGFQVARIDREGANRATLAIAAARPQAFFGWVGQMESDRGLIVDRLSATANSDKTLAVQVTFRARGG
jgi:general secretion pathway protein M